MIADLPRTLLVLLAVLTVLGAVMGYCIALLLAKRSARTAMDALRTELGQERRAAESDLQAARHSITRLRKSDQRSGPDDGSVTMREQELEAQATRHIERIGDLEMTLAALEDKQMKLRRDFASYKTTKTRELEAIRNSGARSDTTNLPTLSRRVSPAGERLRASGVIAAGILGGNAERQDTLDYPLSKDIDIPALSESELPDLVEELDFEPSGAEDRGSDKRG